jgi:hypothetical protein
VADRTSDGRPVRLLNIIIESTRDCLVIDVARKITTYDVLDQFADLFILRGAPDFIRSDHGPEFIAEIVRTWLAQLGVGTLFIEPAARGKMATSIVQRQAER